MAMNSNRGSFHREAGSAYDSLFRTGIAPFAIHGRAIRNGSNRREDEAVTPGEIRMSLSPADAVARCQLILSHAWMVRTFVKHSAEVEEFPELMEVVRTVFDVSRALETRVDDPAGYLHMLRKKIGRLRQARDQFQRDAPLASTHTNFQQAVISLDACVQELDSILAQVS
jgi:hypothetical protein